jgi:hypothetical protein
LHGGTVSIGASGDQLITYSGGLGSGMTHNAGAGTITIPTTGRYKVTIQSNMYGDANTITRTASGKIFRNGSWNGYWGSTLVHPQGGNYSNINKIAILDLTAGDVMTYRVGRNGDTGENQSALNSTFIIEKL